MAGLDLATKRKEITIYVIGHPNKHLLNTNCKPGTVLHAGDIIDNKRGRTCLWAAYTFVER